MAKGARNWGRENSTPVDAIFNLSVSIDRTYNSLRRTRMRNAILAITFALTLVTAPSMHREKTPKPDVDRDASRGLTHHDQPGAVQDSTEALRLELHRAPGH